MVGPMFHDPGIAKAALSLAMTVAHVSKPVECVRLRRSPILGHRFCVILPLMLLPPG